MRGAPVWPDPVPEGLVQPWAVAAYADHVRDMVVGHKERGLWALADVLGRMLAGAVASACASLDTSVPVALVPVPSRPGALRARGHDPTGAMVRRAAVHLRAGGRDARVLPVLRVRPGVADQSGLSARDRRSNLSGALWCPARGVARHAATGGRRWVVVCDDVLTTGSTVREAQRALEAVGAPPVAACVVAASRRRT